MSNEQRLIKFVREGLVGCAGTNMLNCKLESIGNLMDVLPSYEWPRIIDAICGKEETPSESE